MTITSPSEIFEKSTTYTEDAYLIAPMFAIYEEVCRIKGAGAPKIRATTLEMRITRPDGPWYKMQQEIAATFEDACADLEASLINDLDAVYEGIRNEFNVLCQERSSENETVKVLEDELRQQLSEALVKARSLYDGPIKEKAHYCKTFGTGKGPLWVG